MTDVSRYGKKIIKAEGRKPVNIHTCSYNHDNVLTPPSQSLSVGRVSRALSKFGVSVYAIVTQLRDLCTSIYLFLSYILFFLYLFPDKLCFATNVSLSSYSVMFGESPSPGSKMPHFFSTSAILGIASKNNQVGNYQG